jgi:Carboxypeptidase regulatory-like domain
MWKRTFCVTWAVQLILVLTGAAHGQSTARLFGIILDPEGARVPAANIKMTNEATGDEHTTLSDSEGHYQIAALPAATYRIAVYAVGFQKQILENVSIDVGRTLVQDFRMELATVAEEVMVSASPFLIERGTSSVGHVIDQRTVQEIPLNGRYFLDLGLLVP